MSIQSYYETNHNSHPRNNSSIETSSETGTRSQSALAQQRQRGSDRSYQQRNQTNTKGITVMYTILNNGTAMINCDDLQTAIRFVQSLERGLDRLIKHSPYTIVRAAE